MTPTSELARPTACPTGSTKRGLQARTSALLGPFVETTDTHDRVSVQHRIEVPNG